MSFLHKNPQNVTICPPDQTFVERDEHPDEFTAEHNFHEDDSRATWRSITGCPSCDQIGIRYGLAQIQHQIVAIRGHIDLLQQYQAEVNRLNDQNQSLPSAINEAAAALALPGFGPTAIGRASTVLKVGSATRFIADGRPVLRDGMFADYRLAGQVASAIFDTADKLVAHHSGDGIWQLTEYGESLAGAAISVWEPAGSRPPDAGIIEGTEGGVEGTVSFKAGRRGTSKEGHILITDGDKSQDGDGFDVAHDHAGPDSKTGESFYDDKQKGHYTGPSGSNT